METGSAFHPPAVYRVEPLVDRVALIHQTADSVKISELPISQAQVLASELLRVVSLVQRGR